MQTDISNPRLTEFSVTGLYGEFNHRILLNIEKHVTAIIAPNGVGKTLCLKLIYSLFSNDWYYFTEVEFDSVSYTFTDQTTITISRDVAPEKIGDGAVIDEQFLEYTFNSGISGNSYTWRMSTSELAESVQLIQNHMPFMRRIGGTLWIDENDGERVTTETLIRRIRPHFPGKRAARKLEMNTEFLQYLQQFNCKLIEAQRLIVFDEDGDLDPRRRRNTPFAITRKAAELRGIISSALNRYAVVSQSLDSTFPKRVIETQNVAIEGTVMTELSLLDERRKALTSVGILDAERDSTLSPNTKIDDQSLIRLLSIYVDDNKKKLALLDDLYDRIRLFLDLLGSRLISKTVKVSKDSGIIVSHGLREIPLERLSSGEQHQLVLLFELLFEVKPGTLILIDEPEISLHVAWQKMFIKDLLQIISLNKFDVILATHSPQLISEHQDLLVELGDLENF